MRLCCLAIFLFTLGILHAKQPLKAPNQTLNQIDEAFITPQEYGQNLYIYPRSIGCIKCHGKYGEEVLLTSYTHKNKKKNIIVPRINNLYFATFKNVLSKDKGIMPKYNLTDEEINAIYLYISSKNKTPRE